MPDRDDEQFEAYLKGFRPLAPGALPVRELRRTPRRPRPLLAMIAAVATVILPVAGFRILNHHSSGEPSHSTSIRGFAPGQPLTMRDANTLMTAAPSFKSAMDELASPRPSSTVPSRKESALAALAKENIKL